MVKAVTKYIANDGTEFDDQDDALAHESALIDRAAKNYKQYTQTSYSGRELLKKHTLSEFGVWEVRGEDSNCDMGGYHHQPLLGFLEGKLEDVIRKAVSMPGFWTWGGGGTIMKKNPPEVIKV